MLGPHGKRTRAVVVILLWGAPFCQAQGPAAALAKHVEEETDAGNIRDALAAFDQFSLQNGLGMHLGTEKGLLVEKAVTQGAPKFGPHIVLETGCHAGDGTLRAIVQMKAAEGSTIISTEANGKWLAGAKKVVAHAAKDSGISFVPLKLQEDADFDEFLDKLREKKGIPHFDTVILDQDQTRFMSQVQSMLAKGFLRPGATLYVDNAKTKKAKLQKYLDFVSSEAGNGFKTSLHDISQPYSDAVAISEYIGGGSEL